MDPLLQRRDLDGGTTEKAVGVEVIWRLPVGVLLELARADPAAIVLQVQGAEGVPHCTHDLDLDRVLAVLQELGDVHVPRLRDKEAGLLAVDADNVARAGGIVQHKPVRVVGLPGDLDGLPIEHPPGVERIALVHPVAGADLLQVGLGCVVSGATFYLLIMNSPHGADRLNRYLETLADSESISYHVEQAVVALGSGGLFGRGLGASYQKFGYLPAPHTDSVFAVLGEELGLAGCLVVVALFAMLAQRGFRIAHGARDPFGAVLAAGLTCWLIFQALINVAVMTGTIPFTGIPLPFLSMGGSAMVSSLAAVGLLLSISRGSQSTVSTRDRPQPVTASSQVRDRGISYGVRQGGRQRASGFLWRRNRRPRVSRVSRR